MTRKRNRHLHLLMAALIATAGCATAKQGDDDDDVSLVDGGGARDGASDGTVVGNDGSVPIDATVPIDTAMPDASNCIAPISGGSCDTFPQCGCTGTQNCVHRDPNYNTVGCVATGATADYANCSLDGAGQCAKGSICFGGTCHPYCETNANCPGTPYRLCIEIFNNANVAIPGFKVCTQTCDPLAPQSNTVDYDPCGPNTNCFPASDRASTCSGPVGSGVQNASCTNLQGQADASRCAAGFACVSYTILTSRFDDCLKMCRVGGAASQCPGGTVCRAFTPKQYAGPAEIGFCDV